ncbi:hypothetical protein HDA32_005040 [Spinactinospora alkalitolerans]|uniref:DUF1440 domain-containing protein n=1 Tax=Spinactinospora alkalitolerans TaxID=687207 RepID=A0A852U7M1_9ACTN|nr:hypothetical protein [Spinactinospora alkalitolerans]NYE49920.1 hypothetical protein [Spinactinospora alkalitolerans]
MNIANGKKLNVATAVGRGVLAGLGGTMVMTAFQKLAEMPITQREESYAPAMFAERILPVRPANRQQETSLNYVAHYGIGAMWGSAYGVAASTGLRGKRAVVTVFGVVFTGDLLLNVMLGLYEPRKWSKQDVAVDVLDKFVQAAATGMIFDRYLDPARPS